MYKDTWISSISYFQINKTHTAGEVRNGSHGHIRLIFQLQLQMRVIFHATDTQRDLKILQTRPILTKG